MPIRRIDAKSETAVPVAYLGKWVAWNAEHTEIVAAALSIEQLWAVVREKKIDDPVFEKIPRRGYRVPGRP